MISGTVTWDAIASHFALQERERYQNGLRNLCLESDGIVRTVRFVGNPLRFFKYFVNNKSAICANPNVCSFRTKYNIDPAERCAVNFLDRDERTPANRLKVLELPSSVLKPVTSWMSARKTDPGGKDGCDFCIEKTGVGATTRYVVTALEVTPFTQQEMDYIKGAIHDLGKIYKAMPDGELEEKLIVRQR